MDSRVEVRAGFPANYRQLEIERIANAMEFDDCVTFLCMPTVGKKRISYYLAFNPEVGKKYFKDIERKYFDVARDESHLVEDINKIWSQQKSNKSCILIFLDNVDKVLGNQALLELLQAIKTHSGKISLVSFTSEILPFFDQQYFLKLSEYDFLTQSVFYLKPNSPEDDQVLLEHLAKDYELELSNTIERQILLLSGGNNTFLINLLRLLQNGELVESDLFSVEKILSKALIILYACEEILERVGESLSQKLRAGTYIGDTMLENFGIIGRSGKLFSPIFQYYIENRSAYGNIDNVAEVGMIGTLTEQESKVWRLLVSLKGKVVSRNDIAKVMWGGDFSEKYSDWAIDKIIQKIRRKIGKGYVLETKKGRGFILK